MSEPDVNTSDIKQNKVKNKYRKQHKYIIHGLYGFFSFFHFYQLSPKRKRRMRTHLTIDTEKEKNNPNYIREYRHKQKD